MPPGESLPGASAVLTVSEVGVRFGGVSALNDTSLSVRSGTVTGLIGPNGAGKTTLFNVISGLQAPERGSVHLFDTDITAMKPHRRARLGLARTFQRLELFGTLTAAENVQVGLESAAKWWDRDRLRRMGRRRRRVAVDDPTSEQDGSLVTGGPDGARCERLLAGVGLEGLAHRQSAAMSTGLARMVELARALAIEPKLLLLDEPGSGLDESESAALGNLLSKLAAEGMAVLLVEHDMELVMRICDHIYVLDFGDIIASGPPEAIRTNPMVQAAYLGEAKVAADTDRWGLPPAGGRPVTEVAAAPAGTRRLAPGITVSGVRAAYGRIEVIHGVDLAVPPGSVFALLGPNGAGKSTLLKVISGRIHPTAGEVRVGDRPVGKTPPEKLARGGLCAIPEGRGIFPNLTVRENLRIWSYSGGESAAQVEERTFAAFPRLKDRRRQMAGTLSGGEQQMLAISRALVTEPEILLLDELSMGLAPLIVRELYELVGDLARQGTTVLLVEQFVTTALTVATHAAIMVHGRIQQEGSPQEMSDAALSVYLA